MPTKRTSQQQLLAESEDLRARLAQAEASLLEMRSDEVDALVVPDGGGVQLFAPADADQSFRILVGEMSEGALTVTAEGVIVYANRHFAGMLKTPLEKRDRFHAPHLDCARQRANSSIPARKTAQVKNAARNLCSPPATERGCRSIFR